jgi:hypothetical protein
MPIDSREIMYVRHERWLIWGLWAFQTVTGPAIWVD